ncbi:hypothetical protein HHI36_014908 [Cryptolaemus montrouzieri]|uniref:RNase H type-1 domain-containing protein n=1 Tax=Cryptolaemus montrouzieri TaxID=559131 RepID=A0ABD2N4I6_9CUCU
MFAIDKATKIVISRNITTSVIISDSMSALEKHKNNFISAKLDPITAEVINNIHNIRAKGFRIALIWVPSHSYIHHNDVADMVANRGRLLPTPLTIGGGTQEL